MTMTQLDTYYTRLLESGFVVLRQAVESGDPSWIDAELQLLHNVPSLIGDANVKRHRYFWDKERSRYIQWTTEAGRDQARSRMRTYYGPIWDEMTPVVQAILEEEPKPVTPNPATA